MILLTLLLVNTLWIGYALTEGIREGFYWHYENKSKKVCDFNVNPIFTLQRVIVLLLAGGYLIHTMDKFCILNLVCMIMVFPFFHNGTYYYTRYKLDNNSYQKKWTDESKSIPALSALTTYNKRTILMSIGTLAQVFIYLFLL